MCYSAERILSLLGGGRVAGDEVVPGPWALEGERPWGSRHPGGQAWSHLQLWATTSGVTCLLGASREQLDHL